MIEHVSKTGKGVPSRHGLRTSVVKIIRRIQRVRRRTTLHSKSTTEVVNLFPNPRLRTDGETASHLIQGPCQLAGVYVPPQSMAALAEVPGRAGVVGLVVAGSGPRNDTYVAPGGRNSPGAFRLG